LRDLRLLQALDPVQMEGGAHAFRQFGDRRLDLAQRLAGNHGCLGCSRPRIDRIGDRVEAGEQAPFERTSSSSVDSQVAHHPADIGDGRSYIRRPQIGGQAQHHVLNHVLSLFVAREDAVSAHDVGSAMPLRHRQFPR
jgi:hypothetical protein